MSPAGIEVYVRPFPNVTTGKQQVSTSGGTRPLWARDGQELFYESMGTLMRVPLTTGSTFAAGTPSRLFDAPYFFGTSLPVWVAVGPMTCHQTAGDF